MNNAFCFPYLCARHPNLVMLLLFHTLGTSGKSRSVWVHMEGVYWCSLSLLIYVPRWNETIGPGSSINDHAEIFSLILSVTLRLCRYCITIAECCRCFYSQGGRPSLACRCALQLVASL